MTCIMYGDLHANAMHKLVLAGKTDKSRLILVQQLYEIDMALCVCVVYCHQPSRRLLSASATGTMVGGRNVMLILYFNFAYQLH